MTKTVWATQAERDTEWHARLRALGGASIDVINGYEECRSGGADHPAVNAARTALAACMDELFGALPPDLPPNSWLEAVR